MEGKTLTASSQSSRRQSQFTTGLSAPIFAAATFLLAAGFLGKRAMYVVVATCALLPNLFVQYFAKLSQHVHWGLLALGFGVAILVLAILFERKVRHAIPRLKEWS